MTERPPQRFSQFRIDLGGVDDQIAPRGRPTKIATTQEVPPRGDPGDAKPEPRKPRRRKPAT